MKKTKQKLSFNKFQVSKISNPRIIIGGNHDNGGNTRLGTQKPA